MGGYQIIRNIFFIAVDFLNLVFMSNYYISVN